MKNRLFFIALALFVTLASSIKTKPKIIYHLNPKKQSGSIPHEKPTSFNKESIFACLQNYLPDNPIIVETGALDGKNTTQLSLQWPRGTIYAFEPMPENFTLLEKNSLPCHNVICLPFILSDKKGTTEFFYDPYVDAPTIPSRPADNYCIAFNTIISVPTVTLDDWAQQNNLKQIDLLWLSGQECALEMLKASPILLKTVAVIYTEVEFSETHAERCLYKNMKKFLEAEGFTIVASDFDESPVCRFGNVIFIRKRY